MRNVIFGLISGIILLIFATPVYAERFEGLFYSDYYFSVEEALRIGSQKQAIYSYIIANASTPGVDLVALLPPDDRAKILSRLPATGDKKNEVVLEFVLAEMAINNKRLSAFTTLWGNKAKSLKNIVTLGK